MATEQPATAKLSTSQIIIVVLLTLAVVALIAYARGEPGDDGRVGDTDELHVYVEVE